MSIPTTTFKLAKSTISSLTKFQEFSIFSRKLGTVQEPNFGLLFDIDGVLLRGKKPIPAAKRAFERLSDKNGNFRVPVVFVTNAGNAMAKTKAQKLSELLGVKIASGPVMMAHTPLRMFQEFHDKCVLFSGQGPIEEIAKNIGFTNIITIEQIREAFPNLDMVDHKRRPKSPLPHVVENFPKIDAIVLCGEPVRWETSLQLIIDVLLTHGKLTNPVCEFANNEQHLPVLACNMDLLWMSESHMPRFGHGTFLHCLESVFEKLVGRPLSYTALMGKPSEITYTYAERLVLRQAVEMRLKSPINTLYAIGDNPMADIYGANLYNKSLAEKQGLLNRQQKLVFGQTIGDVIGSTHQQSSRWEKHVPISSDSNLQSHVKSCQSVLVCTGVYSQQPGESPYQIPPVFHGPRDIEFDVNLCMPTHITQDVNTALDYIEETECFRFDTPV